MKKILIAAMALAAVALVGCEEYLTEEPQSNFSDSDVFWSSEAILQMETNYFYTAFAAQSYGSAHNNRFYSKSMSDDYGQGSYSEYAVTIPTSNGTWGSSYSEARRANIILARMANMELSDEARKHYEGFCRFYRAWQHFDLVRTYGDCVWQDREVDINDKEFCSQTRTDRAEIMRKVCDDFKFAAENSRDYSSANVYHKYAAYVMLSRAALYEASWQKYHNNNESVAKEFYTIAKNAAKAVIDSGKWSIHENYGANYTSKSLTGNSEMIMFKVFQYDSNLKLGHGLHGYSTSSTAIWGMTKDAVESYCNADGLPIHVSPLGFDDSTVEKAIKGRDARLAHNVCDSVVMLDTYAWRSGMNSTTGYWLKKFVSWSDYINASANNLAPYNDTDGPVYMYSEVLLNYAEACAELGSISQNDLDISINELRTKHGKIPALTLSGTNGVSVEGVTITKDPKNIYGVSELIWEIRRERRNELMCDGFRNDDLNRWKMGAQLDFDSNPSGFTGVSQEAVMAYYDYTEEVYDWEGLHHKDGQNITTKEGIKAAEYWQTIDGKVYVSAFDVPTRWRKFDEKKHYLSPIPSSVLLLNENLTQNPGW